MAKEDRGFASMNPDIRRKICSQGGKAAHANGVAHTWTSEEARAAGKKGGQRSADKRLARRRAEEAQPCGNG